MAENNDDSLEVFGTLNAGLVVTRDHLISARAWRVERCPSAGGAWDPNILDTRASAQRQELARLLVENIAPEERVHARTLTTTRPPWR
ncbi:hypothetical protein P2318_34615 [Myxococcaceae bacterium GXIMD 01537]